MNNQWFHAKNQNFTVNLSLVSEIYWEMTSFNDAPCTRLVFVQATEQYQDSETPYTDIYDASDRVALRKLIIGDDWQPPNDPKPITGDDCESSGHIAELLVKSLEF